MAYDEDIRALDQLEKYRLIALVAAIGMLVLSIALDTDWLDWPRAAAWGAAAVVSVIESFILRRMGRSPYPAYLRAALFLLVGVLVLL